MMKKVGLRIFALIAAAVVLAGCEERVESPHDQIFNSSSSSSVSKSSSVVSNSTSSASNSSSSVSNSSSSVSSSSSFVSKSSSTVSKSSSTSSVNKSSSVVSSSSSFASKSSSTVSSSISSKSSSSSSKSSSSTIPTVEPCKDGEHTVQIIKGKVPSYGKKGLSQGAKCSVCGAVLNQQEEIPEFPDYHLVSFDGNTAEYRESVTGKDLSVDYSSMPTQQSVYDILVSFKEKYPEGMEFDNGKSYITEKLFPDIIYEGKGCAGFAFELSDAAFGDFPGRVTFDYSKVRVGDIIRMYEDSHSVIVLKVEGDIVTVAEGNYNRRVHWERTLDLNDADLEWDYMITRYAD